MADGWITDREALLKEVGQFARLKERRRFERRKLLVAANIEVKGKRFEGVIVDVSPGGARIRFDTPLTTGDELNLMLTELGQLGAQVVWQRQGEAGLRFLLAPDEVAPRVQQLLVQEAQARDMPKRTDAKPSALRRRETKPPAAGWTLDPALRRAAKLAAAGLASIVCVAVGAMMIASSLAREAPPPLLALNAGEQHSCSSMLGRVTRSTNQIDFSLSVASAAQSKCLDLQHPGRIENDPHGHMVQAVKVPVQ